MKYLFTLALTISFVVFAQEDEPSYKYQPEGSKVVASLYIKLIHKTLFFYIYM